MGRTISHYKILDKIGEGGMGVVYKAHDLKLQRNIALKFLSANSTKDFTALQRFLREARAAAALDHVNIGAIFEVNDSPDTEPFIAMAYYEAVPLNERLRRVVTIQEVLSISIQIARGLETAHKAGVVHRDIKPSNILITRSGDVKIVDFGLASLPRSHLLTGAGAPVGTPAYMSPEQAKGKSVDHRTDIWSLGVILYEMLAGRRPFDGPSLDAILYQVIHEKPPALEINDRTLIALLTRCLNKNPEQRYQSTGDLLHDLEAAADSEDLGRTVTLKNSQPPFITRRRWWMLTVVILIVALTSGIALNRERIVAWFTTQTGVSESHLAYQGYQQATILLERWDKIENIDSAIELLKGAIRHDPGSAVAHALLAEAYRLRFVLDRDSASLDNAFEEALLAVEIQADLPQVQIVLGRVHSVRGEDELALQAITKALELDEYNADGHLAMARLQEKRGRWEEAEAEYRQAIVLRPDWWRPYDELGHFFYSRSEYTKAAEQWRQVLRVTPDNGIAYINLGSAVSATGDDEHARELFERAVEIEPHYVAYMNLGNHYLWKHDFEKSAEMFDLALALNDRDFLTWGNLGCARSWAPGQEEEARSAFLHATELAEEALKEAPREPLIHVSLASFHARLNHREEAVKRVRTALLLAPGNNEICATAAEVYELIGNRDEAVAAINEALEMGHPLSKFRRNPDLTALLADPRINIPR